MTSAEGRPFIRLIAGQVCDVRIEELLSATYQEAFDIAGYNRIFNDVFCEYIKMLDVEFDFAYAIQNKPGILSNLLLYAKLDFMLLTDKSYQWPVGGFDFFKNATCGGCIVYDNGAKVTQIAPAVSFNGAISGALLQLARERARLINDEPEFRF